MLSSGMADEKLEDLTLVQLRGLRREVAALLENQATFSKQIVRLYEHVDRLTDEVRRDFKSVNSDIIMLENQNISRHGETISALRRIEAIERPPAPGGGAALDETHPER
jgi:hypothetical protein